jgi:hypothetical protein
MVEGTLEEFIAATIASEEDARMYVFELDPEDFRKNKIAYDVIRKLKSDPKMDIYQLGVEMMDKYGEAYGGFLNKAGLVIQLPEWIQKLKERRAKEKLRELVEDELSALEDWKLDLISGDHGSVYMFDKEPFLEILTPEFIKENKPSYKKLFT